MVIYNFIIRNNHKIKAESLIRNSESNLFGWILGSERREIAEETFGCQDVGRPDDDLPILHCVGHLIGTSDLWKTHATHNENDQPGDVLHCLLRLVLMPVTISSAESVILILYINNIKRFF